MPRNSTVIETKCPYIRIVYSSHAHMVTFPRANAMLVGLFGIIDALSIVKPCTNNHIDGVNINSTPHYEPLVL